MILPYYSTTLRLYYCTIQSLHTTIPLHSPSEPNEAIKQVSGYTRLLHSSTAVLLYYYTTSLLPCLYTTLRVHSRVAPSRPRTQSDMSLCAELFVHPNPLRTLFTPSSHPPLHPVHTLCTLCFTPVTPCPHPVRTPHSHPLRRATLRFVPSSSQLRWTPTIRTGRATFRSISPASSVRAFTAEIETPPEIVNILPEIEPPNEIV